MKYSYTEMNIAWEKARETLMDGFYPPPYNPYQYPTKFERHIKWQKFFRKLRDDKE